MLIHLPIAILTSLSPVVASDTVPKLDIVKECRFESDSDSSDVFTRCSQDEARAPQQLQAEWPQFVGADRGACLSEATGAGIASYVELLICLEMARDARKGQTVPRDAPAKTELQSVRPMQPDNRAVDERD